MKTLLVPLVGAHFRPPAKQVLSVLRVDTELLLAPEPENPYDPKAIRVSVDLRNEFALFRVPALREALEGTGTEVEDLMNSHAEPLHLGYIADSDGKAAQGGPGNREVGELMCLGNCYAQ